MKRLAISSIIFMNLITFASDFDKAVDELVAHNIGLRVEVAKSESAVESIAAANSLPGPEVEFSRVWGTTPEAGNKWALSVSQGFDWPGLYKARSEAARTATTAMQFMHEVSLLDARREARTLLIEYIHNTQLLSLQQEIANNIDSMVIYYKIAAESGLETRIDYNKTVLERIAVHRGLHDLEAEREGITARIQEFNAGLDVGPLLASIGDEYPDINIVRLPMALSMLEERDPAYAAAKAGVKAAESLVKVEKMSVLPGFSIGFEHETEAGDHFNGFSVGITLPSWSRRHSAKAARIDAEAAMMDAEIALNRRKALLLADYSRIDSYRKVIDEYAPVINDKSHYELLHKSLKAGQISFLTYIQEINYFIEAHRDYLDVLYEYNLALYGTKYYD